MATKTVIINGVEYATVPEVDIPIKGGDGALAKFFEISDATVASDGTDMLAGVIAYDSTGVKRTGTIATKSSSDVTVSGTNIVIPKGYFAANTNVAATTLDPDLKSENIKSGVNILGVSGASNVIDTATASSESAASSNQILAPYVAFVNGEKVTGNITSKTSADLTVAGATVTAPAGYYATDVSATIPNGALNVSGTAATIEPVATISNSTGIVTVATQTQNIAINAGVTTPGYVAATASASGTVAVTVKDSTTLKLATESAHTYTPGTEDVTIAAYKWLTGAQTIKGDANLLSGNIKGGVTIFGVAGSSSVIDTSAGLSNPASASQILAPYEAYANGGKVTGTIATKSSADVTREAAVVTIPKGYYDAAITVTVPSGSATTPTTAITATPSLTLDADTGKITASVTASQNVTPTVAEGYIKTGTAGSVSVSGTSDLQLTVKAAQTYTPGTADITIAAGQYLTGIQTIKGDQNLQAGYIVKGKSIFGVAGTLSLPTITQDVSTKVLTIS